MSTRLLHRTATRRPMARASALAGVTLLAAALLAWTPAIVAGWNQSSAESALWSLTNGDRVNNGLKPVQQNSTLVSIARWRSKDMVVNDYFSHNIPACGGCLVFHYYDKNGLQYSWGGENIGWNSGYADADSPVAINTAFMKSTDHRDNILNPVWTHGGIGAYGADSIVWGGKERSPRMYTELFMQAKSAPPPAPKPTPRPVPVATPRPTTAPVTTPATPASPAAPSPTASAKANPTASPTPSPVVPLAATAVRRSGDAWQMPAGYVARDPFARHPLGAAVLASEYRIDAAAPADQGFFETVLGNLLGVFLG